MNDLKVKLCVFLPFLTSSTGQRHPYINIYISVYFRELFQCKKDNTEIPLNILWVKPVYFNVTLIEFKTQLAIISIYKPKISTFAVEKPQQRVGAKVLFLCKAMQRRQ